MVGRGYAAYEARHNGPAEAGSIVYRGSTVEDLNADEFQDNAINGNPIRVLHTRMTEAEIDSVGLGQAIDELPGTLERDEQVDITGGLTSNLGTGIFFSLASRDDIPVTLFLEARSIEGEVVPVTYTLEWFTDHPGALAHVDTIPDGEVHVNGNLIGLFDSAWQDDASISVWKHNIEGRATSMTLSEEEETIAFAPEINLDRALVAMATFVPTGPTVPSIDPLLKRVLPDRPSGIGQSTSFWDDDRKARELWEAAVDAMAVDPDEYWVVAGDWGRAKKTDETLVDVHVPSSRDRDTALEYAYDGSTFTRELDDLPPEITGEVR